MGRCGVLWAFMGSLWGSVGLYGESMRLYKGLWGLSGALWGSMGLYGALWGVYEAL